MQNVLFQFDNPVFEKYRLVKEEPTIAQNESQKEEPNKLSYDELKAEIKAIWNSDALRAYKEYRPNVSIPDPVFVPVSEQCFAKKPDDLLDCIKKKE